MPHDLERQALPLNHVVPSPVGSSLTRRADADIKRTASPIGLARAFKKDEEICFEGQFAKNYFKVVKGMVRSFRLLDDGRRQIDAFYVSGDIFGLECGEAYRFSAEAVREATVVIYKRCSLVDLAARDAILAQEVVDTALGGLERLQQHMVLLGKKSATAKVSSFLLKMAGKIEPDIAWLPMSRTDIGDYLGMTIETVCRTLTRLEREGVIAVMESSRRNFVLRDKATLRRLSA